MHIERRRRFQRRIGSDWPSVHWKGSAHSTFLISVVNAACSVCHYSFSNSIAQQHPRVKDTRENSRPTVNKDGILLNTGINRELIHPSSFVFPPLRNDEKDFSFLFINVKKNFNKIISNLSNSRDTYLFLHQKAGPRWKKVFFFCFDSKK